jgi:hypothetical protein
LQGPIAILSVCVYGRPGFYWWEKWYRCRHRHQFYRCVYARPEFYIAGSGVRSSAVQKGTNRCVSMSTQLIFLAGVL